MSERAIDVAADDDRLLANLRAGAAGAFDVLVDRYHQRLAAYLYHLLGDRAGAEDIAQETFVVVFTSLHTLTDDRSFEAWLFTIARNRARVHLRRRRILEFVPFEQVGAWFSGWIGRDQTGGIDAVPTRDAVRVALSKLSAGDREALLLHGEAGFTAREIAGILGIDREAASKRVFRARQRFMQVYQEVSGTPPDEASGGGA